MGSIPQLSIIKGSNHSFKANLLHKYLEEQIDKKFGDRTALIFDDGSKEIKTNYNTLNSTANRYAAAMLEKIHTKNLTPNKDGDYIVCVCMKPSDNLINVLLSIWKCGAAYLPIDITFPQNRIDHILNEAKPVLVIYDDDFDRSDIFSNSSVVSLKFSELKELSKALSNANIDESYTLTKGITDLGIILYTSGSTGVPKGVRLRHKTIQNRLEWQWRRFPYSQTETYGIFKTALTFVDSVCEIWGALLNGMTVVIVPKEITRNPSELANILEKYKIERLVLVPTLLRSLLMFLSLQEKRMLLNLKIWVSSGEPLSLQLAKDFFNYFEEGTHKLLNFYGSTEVMGDVTFFACESKKQLDALDRIPIGECVSNTIIYLLDGNLQPVKSSAIGELYVSGANLASGYVNGRDPDRFIENPMAVDPVYSRLYKTGDYASLQKGYIYYEGRTDSQIKIRGHRVDLSEVEKNLLSLDYVEKGVVLCYHAGEIDQALVAFCVINTQNNASKYIAKTGIQIENDLITKLASYMVPQVVVIDKIPYLVNGKVDRQSLLKMYENTNNNDDAEIEYDVDFGGICDTKMNKAKLLFETVATSIGRSIRSKLSASANFYELGGNSLNSIFTVTKLRDSGYFISITDFITAPTLGDIIDKMKTEEEHKKVNPDDDLGLASKLGFKSFPLANEHKKNAIEIVAKSFYEKADLEVYIKEYIKKQDYIDIMELIWNDLVSKGLSFIIMDSKGRSCGVSLNFDARDEPEIQINSKLVEIFEFLEHVEGPIRENQLPKGMNQILHTFMMATSDELNASENIAVMHFMEKEALALAKKRKFAGIFTTNTSPLTQQLGQDVYGYQKMLEYPINKFVYHDGTKPFGKAPDTKTVIVHWKDIRNLQ